MKNQLSHLHVSATVLIVSIVSLTRVLAQEPTSSAAGPISAVVVTDKLQYSGGQTAVISGWGFVANEIVTLQVLHTNLIPPGGSGNTPWTVAADANGRFVSAW